LTKREIPDILNLEREVIKMKLYTSAAIIAVGIDLLGIAFGFGFPAKQFWFFNTGAILIYVGYLLVKD
jgi:hypothetical protein